MKNLDMCVKLCDKHKEKETAHQSTKRQITFFIEKINKSNLKFLPPQLTFDTTEDLAETKDTTEDSAETKDTTEDSAETKDTTKDSAKTKDTTEDLAESWPYDLIVQHLLETKDSTEDPTKDLTEYSTKDLTEDSTK
ncbi:8891_t:CDS:2 [Cetraspora pellucida]|uniref:8891_t:CDS:1 n=1 Tax=Cetraspora pellucida TaxID=1433469 RepID=A0A9N8VHY9_9GLOM|nr:8891_t:CDS:2 [Cetraspora pellucida]